MSGKMLVEAAHPAVRTNNTYLSTHSHRFGAHRERKRAQVALGYTMLVIIPHMLS